MAQAGGSPRSPEILLDLAVSLALDGDCLADVAVLCAEPAVIGRVASGPTVSRAVSALAADAPAAVRAMSVARARAWQLAGPAAPGHSACATSPLVST